ncbi:MAG: hypothetical protein AB1486_11160 [Planctomycetota bacterium]
MTSPLPRSRFRPARLTVLALIAGAMLVVAHAALPKPTPYNATLLGRVRVLTPGAISAGPLALARGERYQVLIEPQAKAHFYVFLITADRELVGLFPADPSLAENPLEKRTVLPADAKAFVADGPPGPCWLVSMAAVRPLDDLPDSLDEETRQELGRLPFEEIPEFLRARVKSTLSSALVPVQLVEMRFE